MAWIQQDPSENWHISFRFGGKRFKRSLKTKCPDQAEACRLRLQENIRLVNQGRLELPANADIPVFLLSDGKINQPVTLVEKQVTLGELISQFFDSLPQGSLEDSTLEGMQIHRRHLERHLGEDYPVGKLSLSDLQDYVKTRSAEVSASTIKKSLVTFRSVWNWAARHELVSGVFPRTKDLRFAKEREKPPFQTWSEIERQIKQGKLSEQEADELWSCLYLKRDEITELLKYVQANAAHAWIYPMFVMAAHTGARRSELLRSQVTDFDGETVIIREKKRVRGKLTTRRVPMSSLLREAVAGWMAEHPGGSSTFCQTTIKKSNTKRTLPQPVTHDEAPHHFKMTLSGSKWEKLKGWHCLRHSFISNLASEGVDQRLIDEFVGHTTEEMRRRYRHLLPDKKADAIHSVFG